MKHFLAAVAGFLLFQTSNAQWHLTGPYGMTVENFIIKDSFIFAGVDCCGMFRSSDKGITWSPVTSAADNTVMDFITIGDDLYACFYTDSVYRSDDNGETWVPIMSGIEGRNGKAFGVVDSVLFLAVHGAVCRSSDRGNTWSILNKAPDYPRAFTTQGNTLYVGHSSSVSKTTDYGETWTDLDNDSLLEHYTIASMCTSDSSVFAATVGDGVFRTRDGGQTWEHLAGGLPEKSSASNIVATGKTIFYTHLSGGYRSTDDGDTWTRMPFGRRYDNSALFETDGTDLYAAATGAVFYSSDLGNTWVGRGLGNPEIRDLQTDGERLYAATTYGVYVTDDNGTLWTSAGLMDSTVYALEMHKGELYATTPKGIFRTSDNGTTWLSAGLTTRITYKLYSDGTLLFATGDSMIFSTTDNGATWKSMKPVLPANGRIFDIQRYASHLFIATNGGVYRSTNQGQTWARMGPQLYVLELEPILSTFFAGTDDGLWRSTDLGVSWKATDLEETDVVTMLNVNNNLFATTDGAGGRRPLYRSSDRALTWIAVDSGLHGEDFTELAATSTHLFIGHFHPGGGGHAVWRRALTELLVPAGVEQTKQLPTSVRIVPNPASKQTVIEFSLEIPDEITVSLFDVLGNEILPLSKGYFLAGSHLISCQTSNVPAGMYYCRVRGSMITETRTLVILP